MKKIPVGISSCLLGEKVRFDGAHKKDSFITGTLSNYFDFRPCCPEVEIGLGIPRPPLHLLQKNTGTRCVAVNDPDQDYTDTLKNHADRQSPWHADLCGYILKHNSPSCGMQQIKVFNGHGTENKGTGIYAAQMLHNHPLLPAEEEGRLADAGLRDSFIQRVYVLQRWKTLLTNAISITRLVEFHARHRLIMMSHGDVQILERLLAQVTQQNLVEIAPQYLRQLLTILKHPATRQQHIKVLRHIISHLQKPISRTDQAKLNTLITRYQHGEIPLLAPLKLLQQHLRHYPDSSIENGYYLSPYPQALQVFDSL